jgi:Flp pilus assembly protein TadD
MNRLLTGTATVALCALWASGCASMEAAAPAPKAAVAPASASQLFNPDADTASIVKDLPGDLPGEIERAHVLRVRGDYADSEKALAQLMLIAPDNPRIVSEYGKALLQQGRAHEAASFLKRAAELSPNDWTIYSAMGVAFDQAGDFADAKLAYQHALSLKPGEPAVLNNLAISRMLAGDVSGARTILAKASETGAGEPKIAHNLAAIDAMQKPMTRQPSPPAAVKAAAVAATVRTASTVENKPVTQAALAPVPVKTAAANTEAVNAKATLADEKKLGPGVVMEPVPVDPLAGPVATHEPRRLVRADTAKPAKPEMMAKAAAKRPAPAKLAAAKPKPGLMTAAPALRTASDSN